MFETITENLELSSAVAAVIGAGVFALRRWFRAQFKGRDQVLSHELYHAVGDYDDKIIAELDELEEKIDALGDKLDQAIARLPRTRSKKAIDDGSNSTVGYPEESEPS